MHLSSSPFKFLISCVGVAFLAAGFCSATALAGTTQNAAAKKRVLADLDSIQNIFTVKYAPKAWKREFANWDLDQAIQEAKDKVVNHSSFSLKEGQIILRDFFSSAKDYHVGVRFYSTEAAFLPFMVKSADQRYFVSALDRKALSKREFPFEVGDEILTFGGQPIHDVVQEIRQSVYGENTFETDQALAEIDLTFRKGEKGHYVPSGRVVITGIAKDSAKPLKAVLNWFYTPEKIQDFSKIGSQKNLFISRLEECDEDHQEIRTLIGESHFFKKYMVPYIWDFTSAKSLIESDVHSIGAKSSFIPPLGKKIWKTGSEMVFDAYIFETTSGKQIGYIRIPHYMGDSEEVDEFGTIMNYFQSRTDALVIDQINNPGGSVFYLYGLVSTLANRPFYAPKHHIALTQEDIFSAQRMLPYLNQVWDDSSAKRVLGDTMGGYPVDYAFVQLMIRFCNFIISEWNEGKLFSDAIYLFGVDEILPHPDYRYNKPILLLVNSLDFSAADFLPSILKDNERALILGSRTAGAGGYVLKIAYPNHSGIKSFVMTGSLAERKDKTPIENLGVVPDVKYELSVADLQGNYQEYAEAILKAVDSIIQ